jgi:hypothetical protein
MRCTCASFIALTVLLCAPHLPHDSAGRAEAAEWAQASKPGRVLNNRADDVLARARRALGGARPLGAVKTLEVEGTDQREGERVPSPAERFAFRMFWPDEFQIASKWFVHTLHGASFWRRQTGGPAIARLPGMDAIARQSTERDAAILTLTFLLRTTPSLAMRAQYVGMVTLDDVEGETIEFTAPNGFVIRLVLSHDAPSAIISSIRRIEADGSEKVLHG